jgi:hypothetical protein
VLHDLAALWAVAVAVLAVLLVVVVLVQAAGTAIRQRVARPKLQPVRLVSRTAP